MNRIFLNFCEYQFSSSLVALRSPEFSLRENSTKLNIMFNKLNRLKEGQDETNKKRN